MKKYILFPAILILIISCTKKKKDSNISSDYFPMKIGNIWNYKVSTFPDNISFIETVKIVSDTMIEGNVAYKFETSNDADKNVFFKYFWIQNNKIQSFTKLNNAEVNYFFVENLIPYKLGNSWSYYSQNPSFQKKIIDSTTYIWEYTTLPAYITFIGTEVLMGDNGNFNTIETVVPGIGIVRSKLTAGIYGKIHTTIHELISMKIQ